MDLRIFTEPQLGASHADLLAAATATRDGGFSAFFRSDHLLTMGGDGLPGPSESLVNLGALAAQVPDLRFGTLVASATFRHPAMLAIAAAQVDDISGGRLELGLGSGWYEAEHRAYGIDFGASFGERFDRLTEQLEILTGLWSTPIGQTFSHAGEHYTLDGAPGLPKPVQTGPDGTPKVPIIIGGGGPKRTPALVARFADEYNSGFVDLEETVERFERVRAACRRVGRDPDTLVYSSANWVCCGRNDAEVRRRADALGADAARLVREPMAGTSAELVDRLGRWADAGVQRVYLQVIDVRDLAHIELLASEVLPAFR